MEKIKSIADVRHQIIKACEIYKLYPNPSPADIHSSIFYPDPDKRLDCDKIYYRPTPKEIDDADLVQFDWFPRLTMMERRLLWKRFSGMGWKRVAAEESISERTARNYVNKALEKLYNQLN